MDDVLLRKDVDLVVILCPPSLHSQIAVKALGIGKHVVCGVPGGLDQVRLSEGHGFTPSVQGECLRMVQAAQYYPALMAGKAGSRVGISLTPPCPVLAYSQRFLPSMAALRRHLRAAYLGETVSLVDVKIDCGSILEEAYSW